jgi:hypothetical protein
MTTVVMENREIQVPDDTDLLEFWTVKVSDLKKLSNPMDDDVWGCGFIDVEEVLSCDDVSHAALPAGMRKDEEGITWADDIFSREYNIARIAWLARNGWDDTKDPISLDVYPDSMTDWPAIVDGNHRFSAAIVSGMESIRINPSGDIDFLMDALKPSKIEYIKKPI